MGFSQEIKEFIGGFEKGWRIAEPSEDELKRAEHRRKEADVDAKADQLRSQGSVTAPHVYGSGGDGGAVEGIRTAPTRFQTAGADPSQSSYINNVFTAESGNNPNAKNKLSSATGLAQFTTPTWAGLMRRYPELGLTANGRTDPEQSRRAMTVFTRDNAGVLKTAGFGTDPGNLYVAHTLGAKGATRMLRGIETNAEAPASAYMTPEAAAANPTWVRNKDGTPKTARQWYQETTRKTRRLAENDVDDGPSDQVTQFAAAGGRVMSNEEALDIERASTVEPGGWSEPTVAAEEAPTIAAEEAPTIAPQGIITGSAPRDTVVASGGRPPARHVSTRAPSRKVARRAIDTRSNRDAMADQEAIAAQGARVEGAGPDDSGAVRTFEPKDFNVLDGIGEAVDAGMKGIARFFGLDRRDARDIDTQYPQRVQRLHRNEGAATPAEIEAIDKVVDPRNQLSSDARAVARMYAGYSYYAERGEYRKAEDYSKSLLLYIRGHMQMAGAVAKDHLKDGNVKAAARAISEAHNQVPDGSTMYVDKVGPDGKVDYRMVDDDGDLTERGSASVNQLMQLAVGMENGSEWYRQMSGLSTGAMTAAQKLAEKRRARDEEALQSFNSQDTGEFMQSLTDEQRANFNKMSPQIQDRLKSDYMRRKANERAEASVTRREERDEKKDEYYRSKAERQDKKDADAEAKRGKEEADSLAWSGHEDAIRDAQDALAAQMSDDPEDEAKIKPLREAVTKAQGAASDWMAQDGGRTKYSRALRELSRAPRGGGGPADPARSGAGGAGTKDERKISGLEQQYISLERKVRREGNTEEGQKQLRALRSDVEYAKRATNFDDDTQADIGTALSGIFEVDDITQVPDKRKAEVYDYQDAVNDILRGANGITVAHAVGIAKAAADTQKIERMDDGRYSINGSRPIYMSRDGIRALAAIYQRKNPKPAVDETKVSNPFDPNDNSLSPAAKEDARDNAEREAKREAAAKDRQFSRKRAEYQKLVEELGDDYRPSMTMAQMRRARTDRIVRNRRLGVEGYTGQDPNLP